MSNIHSLLEGVNAKVLEREVKDVYILYRDWSNTTSYTAFSSLDSLRRCTVHVRSGRDTWNIQDLSQCEDSFPLACPAAFQLAAALPVVFRWSPAGLWCVAAGDFESECWVSLGLFLSRCPPGLSTACTHRTESSAEICTKTRQVLARSIDSVMGFLWHFYPFCDTQVGLTKSVSALTANKKGNFFYTMNKHSTVNSWINWQ